MEIATNDYSLSKHPLVEKRGMSAFKMLQHLPTLSCNSDLKGLRISGSSKYLIERDNALNISDQAKVVNWYSNNFEEKTNEDGFILTQYKI